jgi:uncharacterized delta-60 repeat protein
MVVAVVFSAGAKAAPGDLDLTFSGDGKQTTNLGLGISSAAATVRQPDGKIVAVGHTGYADLAVARYNPNGSLDTSFSGDGKHTTDFGGFNEAATGVALQGDGKIVAVGNADVGLVLARYNPNGSLDRSFSGDGKQTTEGLGATGVALQGDRKIVAVGSANTDFALARYDANGTLDTSFSGDGIETTDFGGVDQATTVALQGDGKIVAVGSGGDGDFAVARYKANGSLDGSFSGDGKQTTDVGGTNFDDRATGVALQGDGKIVAVGQADNAGGSEFALARYKPSGSLDTSFSGDGKRTTDFGGFGEGANGVALQGDRKIVAVGVGGGAGDQANDFALARYNPNGSLDTSFSGDGKRTTDFGGTDGANGVALQTDGRIVAVGASGPGNDFALARYNPNGSLDATFSGDGKRRTDFGGFDEARGVALQDDGKIVVVGDAEGGKFVRVGAGAPDFALARYNANGSLDTSFSGNGRRRTDFGAEDEATGVALQGDGKIVAVGVTGSSEHGGHVNFALARYNPNGSLDTSFSGNGRRRTDFVGRANGVALQGDGKIVVVGSAGGPGGADFALARYNPNGSLDTSFSGNGMQTTDFGGFDEATGVTLQGDGRIVAVGHAHNAGGSDFALARYNPNGSLDTSFSADGMRTTDFGSFDEANGVALQGDGKIVAVGRGDDAGDFALARYNPNGSLDPSFSADGRQTTNFGGFFDHATGVALQTDGKIVAAGAGVTVGDVGAADFALARYNPNGSLDPSFSADGKQTTDFGGDSDAANGVVLQGNGKIVAAGAGLGPNQTRDFALARYLGG